MLAGFICSVVAGCGGGQSNTAATEPQTGSSLVVYQFTATIQSYVDIWAPFPAAIGEVITGTFSYDPTVDTQKPPAGVQVKIRSITLNSDLSSMNSPIVVQNDVQRPPFPVGTPPNKSDIFQWLTNDTTVAAQYGLAWIQTSIIMEDTSGTVFSDSKIPASLNLSQFNNAFISIGKQVQGVGGFNFCRAPITSLHRLP